MDRHRLTSVQLTQFYLHRIKKLNPTLHAVITVSPTALADARAADKARRRGDDRPLLGIPIIVKDNIEHDRHADDRRLVGARRQHARRTRSSSSGCGPRARSSSPRRTCPSGRTSGPGPRRAAGAASAARRTWPTSSTATPAARAPASGVVVSADLATVGRRHRDRRLDRLPVGRQRHRRHQAHPRALEPRRDRADLGRPGHGRPDDPQRHRRRGRARRRDRHRRGRPGDGRAGGPRARPTTRRSSTPTRSRAPGSASGARARSTPGAPTPEIDAIMDRHHRRARGPGRDGRGPRRDPDLGAWADAEFPALLCEFKSDIASVPRDVHRPRATRRRSQDLIDFNNAHPDLEGPATDSDGTTTCSRWPRRPAAATPTARRSGRSRRRAHAGGDRRPHWPRTTSTRSSRRPTGRPG